MWTFGPARGTGPARGSARWDETDGRRLLVQIGPEYEGFTAGVVREKAETGLRYFSSLRLVDGYAIVSDRDWLRELTHIVGFLLPFPLRVFRDDQRDEAIAWLSSLPEGPGVSHRILPDSGLIVVEVTEPLRAQDFDALAVTADTWLETHDKVRRVALAADSKLADLAPLLPEHFVQAEVKGFGYDELDRAIAWAAGSGGRAPGPTRAGHTERVTTAPRERDADWCGQH